jgi:hypothetical protein
VVLEQLREFEAGELAALIGVEDLGLAIALDCFLYRLVSAPLKKSFSNANCPIFACNVLRSGSSPALTALEPPSNTSAARSSNCRFHSVTWFGWTS